MGYDYHACVRAYDLVLGEPSLAYKGIITLYLVFDDGLEGLASIYFVPLTAGALPTCTMQDHPNPQIARAFDVFCWLAHWDYYVDFLRNEQPVAFFYSIGPGVLDKGTSNNWYIERLRHPVAMTAT